MNKIVYDKLIILQHCVISLIGIFGNLMVLLVYRKKLKDKQTITYLICHLAFTDLFCCIFLMPLNCYHEIYLYSINSDFMCKFHSFLNILNITYSCFLMVLVAFERYFSINFTVKKIFNRQLIKILMLTLFCICFTLSVVGGVGVGVYHEIIEIKNYNKTQFNESNVDKIFENSDVTSQQFGNNSKYWLNTGDCFPNNSVIPRSILEYIILFQYLILLVNFILIFIIYALIIHLVLRQRKLKMDRANYYKSILNRSKMNSNRKHSLKIGKIL